MPLLLEHNPPSHCSKDGATPKFTFASLIKHLWEIGWTGPVILHCTRGTPIFAEFDRRRVKLS